MLLGLLARKPPARPIPTDMKSAAGGRQSAIRPPTGDAITAAPATAMIVSRSGGKSCYDGEPGFPDRRSAVVPVIAPAARRRRRA